MCSEVQTLRVQLTLQLSISQWHIGRVSYSVVQDAKNPSAIFNCGPAAISCNRMAAKHGVVQYHQLYRTMGTEYHTEVH